MGESLDKFGRNCFLKKLLIICAYLCCFTSKNLQSISLSEFKSNLISLTNSWQIIKKKTDIPKIKNTQTNAYLSIPYLKTAVDDCYGSGAGTCPNHTLVGFKNVIVNKPEIKNIVSKVIAKEEELKNSHYVFYHAHDMLLRLLFDFNTEMCYLDGNCDKSKPFVVLRNFGGKDKKINIQGKEYSYFNLPDINTWMDNEKKRAEKGGFWKGGIMTFNHEPSIKPFILSVNLSLFGNIRDESQHTFRYFLNSLSAVPPALDVVLDAAVSNFVKNKTLRNDFVAELMKLVKFSTTEPTLFTAKDRGILLQICIPRNLVDELVYLSKPYGLFWYDYISKTDTHAIYSTEKKRYIALALILKKYQNNPKLFDRDYQDMSYLVYPSKLLDSFQARILLKGEYFSGNKNNNDIRIYRYSTIDSTIEKKYMDKLRDICQRIYKAKDT